MKKQKTIFVTGITGNQGGAVAKHLLRQKHDVVGLTRNASSKKSQNLKEKSVVIVEGDLNNPDSLKKHLNNIDAVFLVQALQGQNKEVKQGKQFIDLIASKKDMHLVYASILGANLNTGVPHFESKHVLENHIKSKVINYSILRPASFYENHLFPRVAKDIKKGKYISPLKSNCKQQMIGVDDIGKIASKVISNSEKYKQKTLSIATDEWQIGDIPKVFSEAINKPVSYKKLPDFITRLAMGKDLYKMFKYMNANNFNIVENIEDVKQEFGITEGFRSWVTQNFKY